ncbi:MAG: hypothetical protein ACPGO7_01110 [Alphaproteobacteria bacterium]
MAPNSLDIQLGRVFYVLAFSVLLSIVTLALLYTVGTRGLDAIEHNTKRIITLESDVRAIRDREERRDALFLVNTKRYENDRAAARELMLELKHLARELREQVD